MYLNRRFAFAFSMLVTTACVGGKDITSPMAGTYHGAIVSTNITSDSYDVTVSSVDDSTVAISGADFTTFEVEVMDTAGTITTLPDDAVNTLSWVDGLLDVVHEGDEDVSFSGALEEADGDTDSDSDSDTDSDSDSDTDSDTDADSASAAAEGTYTGAITGPVIDASYTLTVTALDADTVECSGDGITSFEVPVVLSGGDVDQAGTWSDGSFSLSGDALAIVYDPQSLNFSGTRD